ncbi:MAG: helix-turn-helix domain-containing protein [Clostridiales bacterium]|jgi:transcriptional regulator with XRE-family HTH domain|nr:helix-turn-helix domain-containing protein [Clostridiales bacterium]
MDNRVMLGDFIRELRKEKGLSQDELGYRAGVSNKAVSKWETGEANPDLNIIPRLADALGVSCDELLTCVRKTVADDIKEPQETEKPDKSERTEIPKETEIPKASGNSANGSEFDGEKLLYDLIGRGMQKVAPREYVSRQKTQSGKPYVHINFNNISSKAEGMVAIGFRAKGVISIGLISCGVVSVGLLSFGLFAFGMLSFALIAAFGSVSIGLVAGFGAVAAGFFAFGAVAVGFYAFGAFAVGYFAYTGNGGIAIGVNTFTYFAARLNGYLLI